MASSQLVSIIIPCYNHGHYLSEAIESVFRQTYQSFEIVIVDDGSTDNTREVVEGYAGINYIYQKNQGLSAARNKGIQSSTGNFLVFLDADDWLMPCALSRNLKYFSANPDAGMVAGAYQEYHVVSGNYLTKNNSSTDCSYESLLIRNHLKMHGAVMFPRWVFTYVRYDKTLRSCEDWDLYLKIASRYPVVKHTEVIAVYRRYANSMSTNYKIMLTSGIKVMQRQKYLLRTKKQKQCYLLGKKRTVSLYTKKMFNHLSDLRRHKVQSNNDYKEALWKFNKGLYFRFLLKSYLDIVYKKLNWLPHVKANRLEPK